MFNLRQQLPHYLRLMRFDKPIGILLLLWPTLWALWIAAHGVPRLKILIIFIIGVVVMRAAGCIVNDYADRDIDKYVQRTHKRPLTSGTVTVTEASGLFVILCLIALGLVLLLNKLVIGLAVVGILLAVIYPFLKRFTHLPQLWLGVAFSWGIPMVFAAQTGHVPSIAWLLFLTAVLWPIAYDTQYAMVDREDDFKIGVKSTAILFGRYDRLMIGLLQFAFIGLFIVLGLLLQLNFWFYLGVILATGLLVYQQILLHDRVPKNCFKAFLNNNWVGLVIFVGLLFSYI